jgi:hypothetical protein
VATPVFFTEGNEANEGKAVPKKWYDIREVRIPALPSVK